MLLTALIISILFVLSKSSRKLETTNYESVDGKYYLFMDKQELTIETTDSPPFCFLCNEKDYQVEIKINDKTYSANIKDNRALLILDELEENTYEANIKLLKNKKTIDSVDIVYVYDKTGPTLTVKSDNNKIQTPKDDTFYISTDQKDLDISLETDEEVSITGKCSGGGNLTIACPNNIYNSHSHKILTSVDYEVVNLNEDPLIMKLDLQDKAGNKKHYDIYIYEDKTGPQLTLITNKKINTINGFSCEKNITIQIQTEQEATVKINAKRAAYNQSTGYYEVNLLKKEGVENFVVKAKDKHGNPSEKTFQIDGICRGNYREGSIHPYCYQKAIIFCTSEDTSCILNYVNSKCGQYH